MLRNTHFKPTKYIPRGNPNRIEVSLIGDANTATQRVIGGQADYSNAAIPPDRIASVKSRGHLILRKTANTYYFWMNVNVAPFNKLKVRQAVNYAIDRKALQTLVWGGLGQPTQNILPPTYPSYRKLKLYSHNVSKARQMITAAGAKGANVTVWTREVSDALTAAQYYTSVLNSIGLNAKLTTLPRATYYTTIGNRDTKAQTGWARWLEDYPHPLDWFDVLLNGNRIVDQRQQQLRVLQQQEGQLTDREPEEGSGPHAGREPAVGHRREDHHEGRSVGAVVEPRLPGVLHQEDGLHPHPAPVRHRPRTPVQEVAG